MAELLYKLGIQRLQDYKLQDKRIFFTITEYYEEEYIKTLDHNQLIVLVEHILKNVYKINLHTYNKEYKYKENNGGYFMSWHCDDCHLYKHKSAQYSKDCDIILNKNLVLTHNKPLPIYTILLYLSQNKTEFTGADLHFVDKTVSPSLYDVIFFDSREIHSVSIQKSGIRKNIIIKYYS